VSRNKTSCYDLKREVAAYKGCDPYSHCLLTCYASCPMGSNCANKCMRLLNGLEIDVTPPPPVPPETRAPEPPTPAPVHPVFGALLVLLLIVGILYLLTNRAR